MLADCSTGVLSQESERIIDAKACFNALWNNRLYGMYILEVLESGQEFRFLAFNEAIAKSSPFPTEQLLGKRLDEAFPPEIASTYRQRYASCVCSGHIVEFEEKLAGPTGDSWWNLSIDPVKNQQGEIHQLIVTAADITAKRQAEAALKDSRQVLQQVIDTVPSAIFWKDRESRYLGCNRDFLTVAGLSEVADIVGQDDYSLPWKKEEADWFREWDRRVMAADRPELDIVEPQLQADGTQAWLSTSKIPLHDDSGRVNGVLGIVKDITERKADDDKQARLLAILEATPDVIAIADARGNSRYLNRAGQLIFDVAPGEVEAFNLRDVARPDMAEMLLKEAMPAAIAKGSWHGESMIRDCHGRDVPVSQVIICHKADDGTVEYFSLIMRDISDRKAAETVMQETAERQEVLNQISNELRTSLDLDTVISTALMAVHHGLKLDYCGFAWLDMRSENLAWEVVQAMDDTDHGLALGQHPGDRLGIDIHRLAHQKICRVDDASACENAEHRAFLNRLEICSEILIPTRTDANKTGVIICYLMHQPRPWSDGEVELLKAVGDQLAIAINQANLYTQSCRQSQELAHTLDQLKRTQAQILQAEKMSSLGQMVAGVAHDINNPVNFIHGNLEPAQEYTEDLLGLIALYGKTYPEPTDEIAEELAAVDLEFVREDLPKLLKSMAIGTDRIREIVLSLRNFSRLDEAAVKTVDLHEGIDSTLVILSHRLKGGGTHQSIEVIKRYSPLPQVDCYPSQLNQVLMNILANAIDALEDRDQPKITVTTELERRSPGAEGTCADLAVIRIADNGSGIPPEIQTQILDPFFTTKPVGKGTGMGMSISYQIVTEKHGGELTFISEVGKGTEFAIAIPVQQAEAT